MTPDLTLDNNATKIRIRLITDIDYVTNLMDHSDLDLANFEAICTKTPPHSSLASSNFINSRT